MELTFKKGVRTAEQDRRDFAAARARWCDGLDLNPSRLVFVDETWAKTNMAPVRRHCRRGERMVGKGGCDPSAP
ncbi:hypothetical protein [uncultured Enterovirga sp.]|uniref:hypothetical protein n=1 Tax=uncultured Enterovirga sp. TaxID=2026352 RepID=UPI0035CC304E